MLYKEGDRIKIEVTGRIYSVDEDVVINGKKTPYNYHVELDDGRDLKVKGSEAKSKI